MTFYDYMEHITLTDDYMMISHEKEEDIKKDAYIFNGLDFEVIVKEMAIYIIGEVESSFEKIMIKVNEESIEPYWI